MRIINYLKTGRFFLNCRYLKSMFLKNLSSGQIFRFLFIFVFIIICPVFLSAQSSGLPVYSAELFYPVENIPDFYSQPDFGDGNKDEAADGKKEILKEAQFLFSGMIYGFKFKYIPGDKRRGVEEVFIVTPIQTIPWGDPQLKFRLSRQDEKKDWFSFKYYTAEYMKSWIMYWSSGTFPLVGGKAEGAFLKGFSGKKAAVKNAVREAVHNYLRSRVHNKPQKIEGEFIFASPPLYHYEAGIYSASVKIKLNVEKISEYTAY